MLYIPKGICSTYGKLLSTLINKLGGKMEEKLCRSVNPEVCHYPDCAREVRIQCNETNIKLLTIYFHK